MSDVRLSRTICGQPITIISHAQMHLDEILALWLIEKFATPVWLTKHCVEQTLMLGVGRGEFDEHPVAAGDQRTKEDCCATLVAKSLGVADNRALGQILKFVFNVDVKGVGQPFDLYNMVKVLNGMYSEDPSRVINWVYEALEAKYAEQLEFAAAIEAANKAKMEKVSVPGGELRVLIVHTDNTVVNRAAMSDFGSKPDLLIIKNSRHQVQIFANRKSNLHLARIARFLRIAEWRARKLNPAVTEEQLCGQESSHPADCWYYFAVSGEMILNGSIAHPDVPATKLSLPMVLDCIRLGLLSAPARKNGSSQRPAPSAPSTPIQQPEPTTSEPVSDGVK